MRPARTETGCSLPNPFHPSSEHPSKHGRNPCRGAPQIETPQCFRRRIRTTITRIPSPSASRTRTGGPGVSSAGEDHDAQGHRPRTDMGTVSRVDHPLRQPGSRSRSESRAPRDARRHHRQPGVRDVAIRGTDDRREPSRRTDCLAPSTSFHVTVMDGISSPHLGRMQPGDVSRQLAAGFDGLPDSLVTPHDLTAGHDIRSVVSTGCSAPIRFELDAVRCRGHALLAELRSSVSSEPALARLDEARRISLGDLGASVGLDLVTEWRPHVTLGYVVNRDVAAASSAEIEHIVAQEIEGFDDRSTTISLQQRQPLRFHRHGVLLALIRSDLRFTDSGRVRPGPLGVRERMDGLELGATSPSTVCSRQYPV